ncbi:MAG: hypothetical protein ACE5ES_03070 [Candidatus Nanoarchaeia archaeon]
MNLEVGDIVLCTVDRIVGTIVFVKIALNGKEKEGSIILSEIAPGRIRNLRDYVVPKKKIVCKVLRISGDRIDLSLRRVTPKEQKEFKEKLKQEKSCKSVLKSVLGEKAETIIKKIQEEETIYEFCESAKENPKELEKLTRKEHSKKILEILKTQKQKKSILKKQLELHTDKPKGLELLKEILCSDKLKDVEIKYISAGNYSLKKESDNLKKADQELRIVLDDLEKQAKQKGLILTVKGK